MFSSGSKLSQARVFVDGSSVNFLRADGSFVLHGLSSGSSHFLEFSHPDYQFSPIRLDLAAESSGRPRAFSASTGARLPYPLNVAPSQVAQYFQQREPVNFWALLKNPMVLMMGFTALIVVVFPKLIGSLDPKELEELQAQQAKFSVQGLMKGLDNKQK